MKQKSSSLKRAGYFSISNYLKKIKQKVLPQLFIIYTRYLIGAAFVFASVVKIKGERFTTAGGADMPIDTAWHMFETLYQSGLWWKFLGLGQLIAGFILMTQRYSKLGALMFFPVISNVFIITLSYDFKATPVITGLMLIANILLLLWDWDQLKILFNKTPSISTVLRLENMRIWELTGLALFLFTAIYRLSVSEYNILFWSSGCLLIGLTGLIIGLYRYKKNLNKKYNAGI